MSDVPSLYVLYNEESLDSCLAAWSVAQTFDNAIYAPYVENKEINYPKNSYLVFLGSFLSHSELLSLTVKYTITVIETNVVRAHSISDLGKKQRITLVTNEKHCLCSLAWEYFQGEDFPPIITYAKDNIQKTFDLQDSREIWAYIIASDYKIDFLTAFTSVNNKLERDIDAAIQEGSAFVSPGIDNIEEHVKNYYIKEISGFPAAIVNSTSNIGELAMAILENKNIDLVLIWYIGVFEGKPQVDVTLKSKQGVNVLQIAKEFGGSGHPNSAKYRTRPEYVKELI